MSLDRREIFDDFFNRTRVASYHNKVYFQPLVISGELYILQPTAMNLCTERDRCKHGNADVLSRLPLPDTVVTAPVLGETILLMDRLEVMPVKTDHIADSTALNPVLQQLVRRVQHGWGDRCPDKSLEPFYRRRNELSTRNGCISWGNRVVIPAQGQKKLLEDLLTAHPGMVRWKIWRGATYGGQGWIQTWI